MSAILAHTHILVLRLTFTLFALPFFFLLYLTFAFSSCAIIYIIPVSDNICALTGLLIIVGIFKCGWGQREAFSAPTA